MVGSCQQGNEVLVSIKFAAPWNYYYYCCYYFSAFFSRPVSVSIFNPATLCGCFLLFGLTFRFWWWKQYVLPKCQWISTGLHSVTFWRTVNLIHQWSYCKSFETFRAVGNPFRRQEHLQTDQKLYFLITNVQIWSASSALPIQRDSYSCSDICSSIVQKTNEERSFALKIATVCVVREIQ